MVTWRTYQSAGRDQSRRALRLPGHRGGSSCLRRWSSGLNEGWSLRTHTVEWFIFPVHSSRRFVDEHQSDKCLQQCFCQKKSIVVIGLTGWELFLFLCGKMNLWMLRGKNKVSCLFHFPNMDFSHCRIITSKLHWAVINRQLFTTAVVWNETTLKCFHANMDQLFEIMGPNGSNINKWLCYIKKSIQINN